MRLRVRKLLTYSKNDGQLLFFFVYLHQSFSLMKKDWIDKELT